MPRKLTFKKISLLSIFILFSLGMAWVYENYFSLSNFPESQLDQKKISKILFKSKLGKQLSFVNVQLEFESLANLNADLTEVKAYITLLKTTNHKLTYDWILPEGVHLVEGSLNGIIENVDSEAPQEVKIKIQGFSKEEKKLISLSAGTMIGSNSFANVGLISSRPEDSFEFIANQKFQDGGQADLSSEEPSPQNLASPRSRMKIQK